MYEQLGHIRGKNCHLQAHGHHGELARIIFEKLSQKPLLAAPCSTVVAGAEVADMRQAFVLGPDRPDHARVWPRDILDIRF